MNTIWRATTALALSIAVLLPVRAVAAPQCGPAEPILQQLHDRYGEVPTFTGIANGIAITVMVSPSGSWTVLGRQADMVCLIASGDQWAAKAADTTPAPQSLPAPVLLPNGQRRI